MDDLDPLVAEQVYERHVLVRHRDESDMDPRLVGVAPVAPGQLLVLATPGAHQVPSLVSALPALLAEFMAGITSVWLGVGGLAASAAALDDLTSALGVDVVAPDGGVAAMPGAALYAGYGAGGTGWYAAGEFVGARFPCPEWESWLPAAPVLADGITAVPAPCGLVIADDGGHDVPVNQRFPKVVVGAPVPPPAAVAALLGELPDKPVMIVPAAPDVATHTWLVELAMRLGREVVFSAGTQVRTRSGALSTIVPDKDGNRLFRPFPLVLRQNARGGDQQVLDIAAAPPGWTRDGRRSYRLGDDNIVADVVPSGLVLRTGAEPPDEAADAAPFDPEGWTLTLGTAGHPVGLPVLTAAEDLLTVLPAEQRAVARVRLAGVLDPEAEHALDRWSSTRKPAPASEVDNGGLGAFEPTSAPVIAGPTEATQVVKPMEGTPVAAPSAESVPGVGLAAPMVGGSAESGEPSAPEPVVPPSEAPVAMPVRPPAAPAEPAPVGGPAPRSVVPTFEPPVRAARPDNGAQRPPVVTMSGAPVSTVSGAPSVRQQGSADPAERPPAADPTPPPPPERPAPAEAAPPASSAPPTPVREGAPPFREIASPAREVPPPAREIPSPAREVLPPTPDGGPSVRDVPSPSREGASPGREGAPAGRALAVPARSSTAAEQARFTAAAGDSFAEALAVVNAAMATWPSMRADESLGAKADYVAVCLFLGRGDGGAGALNGALRFGQAGVLDGQVPCLMSGIHRLPTHRRAVLRQGKVNESLEHVSPPGTVLTEPGFLAGSIELDVTLPGADLDVLIWPSTARRTSELMLSHPLDEAIFLAGARFKALAVRTAEEDDEPDEDDGAPVAPRVAVLYRELAPGETPTTTELDERDLAVLAKLDSVLARRHQGPLRLVEDADVAARLTTSMVVWQQEAAAAVAS